MKRVFAFTLALVMMICTLASTAFAAESPKFTIDNFTAARGETVEIKVMISENPGIAAGKIQITVPETEDGTPVFTIDEMVKGSWARDNVAVDSKESGIYNWASTKNNYNESGEYAIFTVTMGKDVEPGDYVVTIKSSDVQQGTGKIEILENGLTAEIFNKLEECESKAILTVTEKTVVPVIFPGETGDKSDNSETKENEGSTVVINPTENKSEGSDDKTKEDEKSDETKSDGGTSTKAGASISSSGKTITVSTKTDDSTDKKSDSTSKDSTAKTGINEGMHFYLMICLLALALMIPVLYQIKKRIVSE